MNSANTSEINETNANSAANLPGAIGRRAMIACTACAVCAACGMVAGEDAGQAAGSQPTTRESGAPGGRDGQPRGDRQRRPGDRQRRRESDGEDSSTTQATSRPTTVDIGTVADFKDDGVYDALARTDRLLVFKADGKIFAASSICTHKSCVVRKIEGNLACPCHGSSFDNAGYPAGGPARLPLVRYALRVEAGRILVDKTKSLPEKKWESPEASVPVAAK